MSWNGTKTWAASDTLTAADLNTYVRDNTDAVAQPASCGLVKTGTAISNTTLFTISFTSGANELWDPNNMHSTSSNQTRITVPAGWAGKYDVRGCGRFSNRVTGRRLYFLNQGGNNCAADDVGDSSGVGSGESAASISSMTLAAASDYFEYGGYASGLAGGETFDCIGFNATWVRTF